MRREDMEEWNVLEVIPELKIQKVLTRSKQYLLIDRMGKRRDLIAADFILEEFTPLRIATL